MYAPGAPSGDRSLTGGEFLSMVVVWRTSKRSSICAPLRLIDPESEGVWILTRGPEPMAAATVWVTLAVEGEDGCPLACGKGCCLPASIFVLGGFAVGKNLFDAQLQPRSTSALSTIARIRFLLSFNGKSSRNRVVTLPTPRVAAENALQRHPPPARRPIAFNCGDRIGRAAWLVPAARGKDLGGAFLPRFRNQDHRAIDHDLRILSRALASSERRLVKSRSMPLARPIIT